MNGCLPVDPRVLPNTAAGAAPLLALVIAGLGIMLLLLVVRHRSARVALGVVLLVMAGWSLPPQAAAADCTSVVPSASGPGDRAVVVAVIDGSLSPYHYDFVGSKMPQAQGSQGYPLDQPPHTWLSGFPSPASFAAYKPLQLTLPGADPKQTQQSLFTADKSEWDSVVASTPEAVSYRWIPGTKIIGALSFGSTPAPRIYANPGPHGMGTSSVSTGNQHGTCPECLLVFIQYSDSASAEAALTWAMRQPWIDAISNSYGFSQGVVVRDRIYNGTDTVTEKAATDRGQTVFFSAGNGLENVFTIPNSTLLSSEEGPDWVVTVGATSPRGNDFTGTGKPAKVAGIGYGYPSAYGSTTVSNGANFSGTSNATPEVAGIYAHGLATARARFGGASRVQADGVVARGKPLACGTVNPGCPLGTGKLTSIQLRNALYLGATPTAGRFEDGGTGLVTTPVAIADSRFATEGYGTYRGLLDGRSGFEKLFGERLFGVLAGTSSPPARPADETAWFRVDSSCRQHIWGSWSNGSYLDDARTPLPATDAVGWPIRTTIQQACPSLQAPPKQ